MKTPIFTTFLLVLFAGLASGRTNLVDNPSFGKKKEGEKIHRWTISTREGRTRFDVVGGVLTAERTARTGMLPDSCYQYINLPPDTSALRLSVKAGTVEAKGVEVALRFKNMDGGPLGSVVVFRLSGTSKMREMERDLLVPADARDVEVAFILRGAGKATFDDVSLVVVDPTDLREDARVFTLTGGAWVKWTGAKPEEPIRLILPIPPATGSQVPLSLTVKTLPGRRIVAASFDGTRGTGAIRLVLAPLDRPDPMRITWEARVVVFERPSCRALPDALPVAVGRRAPRDVQPFLPVVPGPGLKFLSPRLDLGKGDLRNLAERMALVLARHVSDVSDGPADPEAAAAAKRASEPGRANVGAALLRMRSIPARVVAVVTTGKVSTRRHLVEAWHHEHGWLRFGTGTSDPRPLPFAGGVEIGRCGGDGWPDPLSPELPAGTEGGSAPAGGFPGGDGAFRLTEVGTFSLPKGAAPEFASSAGKSWEKAMRRVRVDGGVVTAVLKKPELKGKAKGAADDLAGFLAK